MDIRKLILNYTYLAFFIPDNSQVTRNSSLDIYTTIRTSDLIINPMEPVLSNFRGFISLYMICDWTNPELITMHAIIKSIIKEDKTNGDCGGCDRICMDNRYALLILCVPGKLNIKQSVIYVKYEEVEGKWSECKNRHSSKLKDIIFIS